MKVLEKNGVPIPDNRVLPVPDEGGEERMDAGISRMQGVQSRMREVVDFGGNATMKEGTGLVGKEVLSVLKEIRFVGVCMLVVMALNLLVTLFK